MGAVQIVERPGQYPGHTVWGSQGRCAYLGEVIRGTDKLQGVSVYVSEREFNELRVAFKFPHPDEMAALDGELAAAKVRIQALEAELADARGLLSAYELVRRVLDPTPPAEYEPAADRVVSSDGEPFTVTAIDNDQ